MSSFHRPAGQRAIPFGLTRRHMAMMSMAASLGACIPRFAKASETPENRLRVERFSPEFDKYVLPSEGIDMLSGALDWPEGPTWDSDKDTLYFSDVARNRIYTWTRGAGLAVYLDPAGSGTPADPDVQRATNGLFYLSEKKLLIVCDQDSRSLQTIDTTSGVRRTLVNSFKGRKFNSPNDLAVSKSGIIYFTDPTAGLKAGDKSEARELDFSGVFCMRPDGALSVIDRSMTLPNGIALSPDERSLYVSQSDQKAPIIRKFAVDADGHVSQGVDWFDFSPYISADNPGMPDGMAVARDGTLFAAGPGGVYAISPEGNAIGRIYTGRPTGNCCFGEDGKTLFITADDSLMCVRTRMSGDGL